MAKAHLRFIPPDDEVFTLEDAERIAKGLLEDEWIPDDRHYEGGKLTDVSEAIMRYYEEMER